MRLKQVDDIYKAFPEDEPWVEIDVADGGFTRGYTTWRNVNDLKLFTREEKPFQIAMHVMMNQPEDVVEMWAAADIKRFIFHLETTASVEMITSICQTKGIDAMIALAPPTTAQHAIQYLKLADSVQVLAVSPGVSGQQFQEEVLEKIKFLRLQFPNMVIEVDGGMNPETAKKCLEAGASQIVATSYIFKADDPIRAYAELREIGRLGN